MRTSSDRFTISANARTRPVDNQISLRFYYRIADNLLKQADIFREEKNFVDLYIMLLRFSSLVTETIPYHKDYKVLLQREKLLFRKKSLNAMSEAEVLKPAVQRKIEELNRISTSQVNGWSPNQNNYSDSSLEWPPVKKFPPSSPKIRKIPGSVGRGGMYEASHIQKDKYSLSMSDPVEEQWRKFSISVPRPKEETLSRHSILGPNGLWGQWQPPISNIRVQYPSNLDLTPIDIPSFQQPLQDEVPLQKDSISEPEKSSMAAVLSLSVDAQSVNGEEPSSMIAFDVVEPPIQSDIIRQPSPPPVLADVHDLMPTTSPQASEWGCELPDELVRSKSPLQLHISTTMMENFLRLAKSNTDKNLETCGILAGSLKNRKFFVTALIIPKQESTSDSCQATNEEEIFDVQDKQSLFPLGWIHTHPSQSCFMSSIDVHTHYSYQIMLPEAVAIVMAPKDSSRTHGVFRLTNPGGMQVIRHCDRRGFHTHEQPPDGGAIYDHCTDVYMNPNLKIDVIDLRS